MIDPGLAFGTGAHATTRLCLELLQELPRGSLLDVGCGSGVLAIAAGKLGFRPLVALDVDAQAVEATAANARANGVEVDVSLADAALAALPETEIAVANLSAAALEHVAPRLCSRLLVASGYLRSDHPALLGYRPLARRTRAGWAADLLRRDE